jgi:hypothetical protein
VRWESFAQNIADLVGPAAIVLDDFVDNFRHGACPYWTLPEGGEFRRRLQAVSV